MKALIAFDKFKDAISALDACEAAAAALAGARPGLLLDLCPIADGGEGFAEILTRASGGRTDHLPVPDARGRECRVPVGFVRLGAVPEAASRALDLPSLNPDDPIAVVDMASASGLAQLPEELRDPWQASSVGTGLALRYAAEQGAKAILLGVGGSATHDMGLGALAGLGWTFLDAEGGEQRRLCPANWPSIVRMVAPKIPVSLPIRIACDVQNPLLGQRGAAAVYAPQKGLRPCDLGKMEEATRRMAQLVCATAGVSEEMTQQPAMGAAGGISFGLTCLARAKVVSGAKLVSDWLALEARVAAADLVLTGEGRFDASSLEGKGPGAVAGWAIARGKEVHFFAGASTAPAPASLQLHVITPEGQPLPQALAQCRSNLQAAVARCFA